RERAVDTLRIGVVEEMQAHRRVTRRESVGEELRTERRSADADRKNVAEALAVGRGDAARVHTAREALDPRERVLDREPELVAGRECWIAQPVVADHALLVDVGVRAALELRHVREGAR